MAVNYLRKMYFHFSYDFNSPFVIFHPNHQKAIFRTHLDTIFLKQLRYTYHE